MINKKKYLSDYPDLMLDWMQELNQGQDPTIITSGSHKRILWHCHKCGREWYASVSNRTNGTGCVCDAKERKAENLRKNLVIRDGSLSQTRPEIARQWHPTLNGHLTPDDVTEKSLFKAWWINEEGTVWQSAVNVRCKVKNGTNPPKSLVIIGINDLRTSNPELSTEWNYEKNKNIDINSVSSGTNRKVWWICPKGHEWKASISSRSSGRGCPICNKERSTSFPEQVVFYYIKKMFSDAQNRYYPEDRLEIDVYIPSERIGIEYDGGYYHSSERKREIDTKKNSRLKQLGITLIRIVEEGVKVPVNTEHVVYCKRKNSIPLIDSATKELLHVISGISNRTLEVDVNSDRDRIEIMEQYILSEKENSLATVAPEVISEWHPTKNGKIKPEYLHAMSNKKFWWKCKKCGYEWETPVYRRTKGYGCPACSGNVVVSGINDLATTHKYLVKEWNFEKNGEKLPSEYTAGSCKKIWWKCTKCGYEWEASISNRTRGTGCPKCAGKIVDPNKSLERLYPNLSKEWVFDLNGNKTPSDYLPGSDAVVWWRCSKGHTWQSRISQRVRGNNCPYCGNKKLLIGFNDFATVHPDLLDEWDKDNETLPNEILSGSNKKVKWICSKGHKWEASISNRIGGRGCPYCSNHLVIKGENDLETLHPELALEWCYEKNEILKPSDVTSGSNRKVWWKCKNCQSEWIASIGSRVRGRGCPYCVGRKLRQGK